MVVGRTGLCPYIYFKQYMAGELKPLFTVGQQNCYVLWGQFDGITVLERDGQHWQLRPGEAFLAGPGVRARWSAPARVTRMVFDLVPRERSPNAEGDMYPSVWSPQPPLRELFGHDLEGIIPGPLATTARDITSRACRFSHHPHLWMRTGALLMLWLVDLDASIATSHDQQSRDDTQGHDHQGSGVPTLVQQAEALLHSGFSPRLRVEDVARQLGMSREKLTRLFKRFRGYGPGRARLLAQVALAKDLLLKGEYDLQTIANYTGFSDKTSLGRAFKELVGKPPVRWQRDMRH